MQADVERVLIDRAAIARRLDELAEQITRDLRTPGSAPGSAPGNALGSPPGKTSAEITLVPILTGSIIFVSDLMRRLPLRMKIRLISVSSYPGRATTPRTPGLQDALTNLPDSLRGCHVLVIDDILDSGNTLRLAHDVLQQKQPASLRTCVLLRKRRPAALDCPVDYVAFDIPDEFVVGYGLDFDDYYRNLPDIVTLRPEVVEGGK